MQPSLFCFKIKMSFCDTALNSLSLFLSLSHTYRDAYMSFLFLRKSAITPPHSLTPYLSFSLPPTPPQFLSLSFKENVPICNKTPKPPNFPSSLSLTHTLTHSASYLSFKNVNMLLLHHGFYRCETWCHIIQCKYRVKWHKQTVYGHSDITPTCDRGFSLQL